MRVLQRVFARWGAEVRRREESGAGTILRARRSLPFLGTHPMSGVGHVEARAAGSSIEISWRVRPLHSVVTPAIFGLVVGASQEDLVSAVVGGSLLALTMSAAGSLLLSAWFLHFLVHDLRFWRIHLPTARRDRGTQP